MMTLQEFLRALDTELQIHVQTEKTLYYIPFENKDNIPRLFDAEIVTRFIIKKGLIGMIIEIETEAGKILK